MTVAPVSEELTASVKTALGVLTLHYRIVDPLPTGVTQEQIVASVTACFSETARVHFKRRDNRDLIAMMVSQQYAHHEREWVKQTVFVTLDD